MKMNDVDVPLTAQAMMVWHERDETGTWNMFGVPVPSVWSYIGFVIRRALGR